MKPIIISCTRDTLVCFNLCHIDFPGDPAWIHWSRTTYSCTTNSASPSKYINPEKSMKNLPNVTHSFLGSRPAIVPPSITSSHACIVFLSEASSSSFLGILIWCEALSFRPPGSARLPRTTSSTMLSGTPFDQWYLPMKSMKQNKLDMDYHSF